MAIPVIYKGDDTDFNGSSLSVNLETDFDLDGCEVTLTLSGCKRSFTGLTGRAVTLPLAFTADETAGMPVGTHKAVVRVKDPSGRVRTASDDKRIRVTDDLREAYGGADDQEIDVTIETGFDPTRIMEGETLKTNTPNSMRQAIKKIAQALGATVSALTVAALPVLGAEVQTAPLGDLDLDKNPSVVTNVTLDGLATSDSVLPVTKGSGDIWYINASAFFRSASFEEPYVYFSQGFYFSGGESYRISDVGVETPDGFAWWPVGFGRIALTNDIPPSVSNVVTKAYVESLGISSEEEDPNVPAWAKAATKPEYTAEEVGATTPEDVTAAIREQSLGGIWDQQLSVWWTPVMSNGKLTYQATTNVNMNAESNP